MRICRFGWFAERLRIFSRWRYRSVSIGRRLHSCFTRPVRIVVRARDCVPGSFSRSTTTIWFSTSSFTMSISYSSASTPISGFAGSKSIIRGFLPDCDSACG